MVCLDESQRSWSTKMVVSRCTGVRVLLKPGALGSDASCIQCHSPALSCKDVLAIPRHWFHAAPGMKPGCDRALHLETSFSMELRLSAHQNGWSLSCLSVGWMGGQHF